jgi:D-alanyl-D-alanine carboxypeptidase
MTKQKRLGAALAAVSLAAIVTACAGPGVSRPRSASIFGDKVDTSNIALATRAQAALAANDLQAAVSLAERAVDNSPRDAGFRALLGNCYLASGRFASAESAFRDSLSLVASQPQIVLKLALVQIAQGKNEEAKGLLAMAQSVLDPADTGLALALAGDPQSAIAVLEPAARAVGADARVRQNLALAYAFAGDWGQARTVAAQDVPGDQLDGRIQQWMTLAKPARASDQVAAFIGIQPVAGDPGQPVRLALNKDDAIRQAAAQPVEVPQASSAGLTSVATVDLPPPPAELVAVATAEPMPAPSPEPVATPEPAPVALAAYEPAPAVEASPIRQARPALSPAAVRLAEPVAKLRRASLPKARTGKSRAVVQLGAFSSRDRVELAWSRATSKYSVLRGYAPVSARFDSGKGTVYRLSVKGFASDRDAKLLCESLKRSGRACFVRAVSGDAPVQFASR